MKSRLAITARAVRTEEAGYWFVANNRWRLPRMVERTVWEVLTEREETADRMQFNIAGTNPTPV